MLRFWEVNKRDALYVGNDKKHIYSKGYYTLTFYLDGVCEIFSFRTYSDQWKYYIEEEDNFYVEEEEPAYYA
jgi:hypothetical protein